MNRCYTKSINFVPKFRFLLLFMKGIGKSHTNTPLTSLSKVFHSQRIKNDLIIFPFVWFFTQCHNRIRNKKLNLNIQGVFV